MVEYRNLYLDASGDPGFPTPWGRSKHEWHVLAGLVFDPESDLIIKKESADILANFISEDVRVGEPASKYELHSTDLQFANNLYSSLNDTNRQKMENDVFDLIIKSHPILMVTAINKTQMKKIYGTNADDPKFLAMRSLINKFSMYLKRKELIGSIVYDAEEYQKDTLLREQMNNFRITGTMIRGFAYNPLREDKLEKVLNTIN